MGSAMRCRAYGGNDVSNAKIITEAEWLILQDNAARLTAMLPLFEEARDALCVIPLATAKLRNISLTLADRMDDVGIPDRWRQHPAAINRERVNDHILLQPFDIEDAQVAPEMNSETFGINERSIGSLTRSATGQNTGVKPGQSAAAQEAKRQSLGEDIPSEQPAPAADHHDYGPNERADRFLATEPGDLDLAGRPLRAGT